MHFNGFIHSFNFIFALKNNISFPSLEVAAVCLREYFIFLQPSYSFSIYPFYVYQIFNSFSNC